VISIPPALFRQILYGMPEYIQAIWLLAFLEWFLPLDVRLVPGASFLFDPRSPFPQWT
jgi:hypothetical protein